jgi:excisionase family DNA binding protein
MTVDRLTYNVPEAAALLGVSSRLVYQLAERNEIPVVRLGRRVLIPRIAIAQLVGGAS